MAKFTPGPWKIAPNQNRYRVIGLYAKKLKKAGLPLDILMASVGNQYGQVAAIPMDESSIENAYLIAAAPEMFELLQATTKLLKDLKIAFIKDGGKEIEKDPAIIVMEKIIAAAEKALANAEGWEAL